MLNSRLLIDPPVNCQIRLLHEFAYLLPYNVAKVVAFNMHIDATGYGRGGEMDWWHDLPGKEGEEFNKEAVEILNSSPDSDAVLRGSMCWVSEAAQHQAEAAQVYWEEFRKLVDLWIESGRADIEDHPSERTFAYWSSAESDSIAVRIQAYIRVYPIRLLLFHRQPHRPRMLLALKSPYEADGKGEGTLTSRAKSMAVYTLLRLILSKSQYAQRIAKCLECGIYYFRKRTRYENGVYVYGKRCPNPDCRKAGNKTRAELSREKERHRLCVVAAEASLAYQLTHSVTKVQWILNSVNDARRNPQAKAWKKKWLTHNEAEIQECEEEITNGRI